MNRKILLLMVILLPIGVFIHGVRPIYKPDLKSCNVTEGVIVKLQEGGELDLVLRLQKEPDNLYYINRGIENTFDFKKVQEWKGKKAKIWYVERWALKLVGNTTWHVARLDIDEERIYDETSK